MPETETPAKGEDATTPAEAEKAEDIEEVAGKAENPDAVRKALIAEREAAKEARQRAEELATKVKEFEDRDKSEQEKLEERASTAEERAAKAEVKLLRFDVAVAKDLPLELADRLQGDTREQLEEDAGRLLELVKRKDRPSGDVGAGLGEGTETGGLNEAIRAAARGR